ncbi:hypothetical protein SAMN05428988_1217 [Chitinophaga sp. YR573]|uniref:hypothetical protein n=1 Tax=Chitinophaga sp. YR573 TaxID=1881040 RepID=UPI0008B54B80|nr:hypothetical protein [Chitinophaga sp. YR573]SEW00948.1 hypothetical protein SAMN05428988_1217 [Chitinophaga sp. YR573]
MTLSQLKQDIIDRWLSAYDEENILPQAVKTVYAPTIRFELGDYNKDQFDELRILSTERLPGYNFIYGLDQFNRPCYFEYQRQDKVSKKGYYTYTDSLIEYIEYDVTTASPSCIQRIIYKGDEKISFQSIRINGTIDPELHGTTKTEIMNNLLKNEYSLFCCFELYHYTDNRISTADCLYIAPASGEYQLQKKYNYNDAGELDEILDTSSDNSVLYSYVKTPTNITLQQLSDQVSQLIATEIIATLKTVEMTTPMGILEIDFQSIGTFSPVIGIFSQQQQEDIEKLQGEDRVTELFYFDNERTLVEGRSFERLLWAFMNEVNILEDYDLAIAMARKTAWILNNNKLNNEIPITKNFMAYSTDWDVEAKDFTIVLKDCGLPEEEINKWKD